jgi:hypothetical protein
MNPYAVRMKHALWDAMEEAEMFGDLDAAQRVEVTRWLNSAKAAKEVAR